MGYGFLAIWCDIGAGDLADYRNWLTREHIADRTVLPGFLGVRLFEAPEDPTSHFILYATASPDVLASAPYRAVLDNPSPWTRRIMPRFGRFDRAAGAQVVKLGNGIGAHVAISRIRSTGAAPDAARLGAALGDLPDVVGLRLLEVDGGATGIGSAEKEMRGGVEGDFRFLLCVEAMSEAGARTAAGVIATGVAELFPGYEASDLSCRRMIYGEAPHETPTGI